MKEILLKEILLIRNILESQIDGYFIWGEDDLEKFVEGHYLTSEFEIYSNHELFRSEVAIDYYKKKYANALNTFLIEKDIQELREKCISLKKYFDSHFTFECKDYKGYVENLPKNEHDRKIFEEENTASFIIIDYEICDAEFEGLKWRDEEFCIGNNVFPDRFTNSSLIYFIENLLKFFNQFDFLESKKKKKIETERNETLSFQDLFIDKTKYFEIEKNLFTEGLILKGKNKITWVGNKSEPNLSPLKLLVVFGLMLIEKNLIKPNIKKKQISEALSNNFGINVSPQNFGKIQKEFINSESYSKISSYRTVFYFI